MSFSKNHLWIRFCNLVAILLIAGSLPWLVALASGQPLATWAQSHSYQLFQCWFATIPALGFVPFIYMLVLDDDAAIGLEGWQALTLLVLLAITFPVYLAVAWYLPVLHTYVASPVWVPFYALIPLLGLLQLVVQVLITNVGEDIYNNYVKRKSERAFLQRQALRDKN